MEKDLLVGIGVEEEEDDTEEAEKVSDDVSEETEKEIAVEELRKQVEQIIVEDEDKGKKGTSPAVACRGVPLPISSNETDSASVSDSFKDPIQYEDQCISQQSDHNSHQAFHTRKMSDCFSDVVSVRSARTNGLSTASTIAPDIIKKKVQVALDKRERQVERKRVLAKGEASATTRSRRENAKTIKESNGLWGWD